MTFHSVQDTVFNDASTSPSRPDTCEYGNSCPKAHSVEELEEWLMRAREQQEIRLNIEAQGFMPYGEKLLEEYRNSSNEVYVVSMSPKCFCPIYNSSVTSIVFIWIR